MDLNDMPYVVMGALASVRDDSINTLDDMVARGKEMAAGTRGKVMNVADQKKVEATIQDLVKKGKKESGEFVESIGKVVKDTLDSLGIVTKNDIKVIDKRLAEVEKKLGPAKPAKKAAAKKKAPAKKKAAKKPARKAAAKK